MCCICLVYVCIYRHTHIPHTKHTGHTRDRHTHTRTRTRTNVFDDRPVMLACLLAWFASISSWWYIPQKHTHHYTTPQEFWRSIHAPPHKRRTRMNGCEERTTTTERVNRTARNPVSSPPTATQLVRWTDAIETPTGNKERTQIPIK